MKILHTISSFGLKSGGTSTSTYDLLSELNTISNDFDLLNLFPKNKTDKIIGNGESWIKAFNNDSITSFGFSHNILNYLLKTSYDIYHTNGLWLYCNHITCKLARDKDKPYIITPHGMLFTDAIRRSYWKKWPLIKLYFKKDILDAQCIHATCKNEAEAIRKFGYKGPIAIIPNPTNLPEYIKDIV